MALPNLRRAAIDEIWKNPLRSASKFAFRACFVVEFGNGDLQSSGERLERRWIKKNALKRV